MTLNLAGSTPGTGPTAPDTSSMAASVTGSAQVSEAAGSLTGFDLTAELRASASRALGSGSVCAVTSSASVILSGTFSTTSPGLLDLDLSAFGPGFQQIQLVLIRSTPQPSSTDLPVIVNSPGRTHQLIAVQAGDWTFTALLVAVANSSNVPGSLPPSADVRIKVHGDFKPFGVADGATTGTGAKYVALPDSQTCASHSVVAGFTSSAGKKVKKHQHGQKPVIKKATFFVNGAKATAVKKPNKNTNVTVGGLPSEDPVTVSATLKLTGKGTVTLERTYLPCS